MPKAKRPRRKSGDTSAPAAGELVPQPHGGALRHGSLPGNTPGSGRPPSEVRAACRESFYARIPLLERIADGNGTDEQRISAIDKLGKYGLSGAVSADDVRERLRATLNEIRIALPEEQAKMLVERIKPHWMAA